MRHSLLLILLLYCLDATSQVNLNLGLAAHYPFNGNANDVSGNNRHGQLMGGIQLGPDRFGNPNSAYRFDGIDDYIRVQDDGGLSSNHFSLAIWFKSDNDNFQNLVGKRSFTTTAGTGGAQYQLFINYPPFPGIGSNLVGNNSTCSSIAGSGSSYINVPSWICGEQWYFVVITFNGAVHNIYVNGILRRSEPTVFSGFLQCNSELRFGNWWQSDMNSFKGLMDDIRWYNRALNTQEVTALYGSYASARNPLDFEFEQNMCNPMEVSFRSNAASNPTLNWSFGFGAATSNSANPTFTYPSNGSFPVRLIANYPGGCSDTMTKVLQVNQVNDSIIQGSDTTVCLGTSLTFRPINNIFSFCWRMSTGTNQTSQFLSITPTNREIVRYTATVGGTNLITNGDFSAGNAGFITDYTFSPTNGSTPGSLTVTSNSQLWNNAFAACSGRSGSPDPMLVVNGNGLVGAKVWGQTLNVLPNTNYVFRGFVQSIATLNPASLQLKINDRRVGVAITADNQTCHWMPFQFFWNSGNATAVTLAVENLNQSSSGNDFALDDLYFGTFRTVSDSVIVDVKGFCDTIKISGTTKICSLTDTITYSIFRSSNCSQSFTFDVDPLFADVISLSSTVMRLKFKREGRTWVRVRFNNDCKIVADSVMIDIKISPTSVNLGPDIRMCRDTSFMLSAGSGFETYHWQNGATSQMLQVNGGGVYYVTATNLCSATFTDTMHFNRVMPSAFRYTPMTMSQCGPDSVTLRASGGDSYTWSPTGFFSNPNDSVVRTFINTSVNFSVRLTDTACSRDTLFTIPIQFNALPNIRISKTNDLNCTLDSAVLEASGGSAYTWRSHPAITRQRNGIATVKPSQTSVFFVSGTDANGCTNTDSVLVLFDKSGEQQLFLPNTFTPNSDGLNDVFRPILTGRAQKLEFKVFNRWGELVFFSQNAGKGWDGTYRGVKQPAGVYVYLVTGQGACNGVFSQKGTFVLLR